jgi:two-component system, cell cycle response regulator
MKILIAEDDPVSRRLLEAHIKKWGHEVEVFTDGDQAWSALQHENSPKLVILDWMMPGLDGIHICRRARELELGKQTYIYIILLTSKSSKQDLLEGLEAGADDYVIKPFDPQELKVRIRAGVRIVQLQQDLLSALRASEFQASHDGLTRIWNRSAILEILNRELSRTRREVGNIGVIMGDIDHFKAVNDQFGHLAGDAVLREVSLLLSSNVRPYDYLGRYGGEEFIFVIPGGDLTTIRAMAERIRKLFNQGPLRTSEGEFTVNMSFGAAIASSDDPIDADTLIRRSDEALYAAKRNGRNRVEVWTGTALRMVAPG